MQNENEFTTPDGTLLVAVGTNLPKRYVNDPPSACFLCYFQNRAVHSPTRCRASSRPKGEPSCADCFRKDGRDVYWVEARPAKDPNPL